MYHLTFSTNPFAKEGLHVHPIIQYDNGIKGMHDQDFYEFTLVIEGRGIHHINGHKQNIEPGSLMLIRPQDTHTMCLIGPPPLYMWNVTIDPTLWNKLVPQILSPDQIKTLNSSRHTPLTHLKPDTCRYMESAISELATRTGKRLLFTRILTDVFTFLLGQKPTESPLPAPLTRACRALDSMDGLREGVPSMTRASGYTREHFSREFKRFTGKTPTAYLTERRLEYACKLLLTTNRKIIDVALDSGFNHLGYFTRTFSRLKGIPPHRWRCQEMSRQEKIRSAILPN